MLQEDDFQQYAESERYVSARETLPEYDSEKVFMLMDVSTGMQNVRFYLHRGNGFSSVYLHLHQRNSLGKCTSICKKVSNCTLSSESCTKRKDEKCLKFSCSQCGTLKTPLWRKFEDTVVCNACGLYSRTHGGLSRPRRLFKGKDPESGSAPMERQDI
ncbi:uncharacterized protein NEMAJ01_0642 [Nematocida major]|uniref:uncharacterized protein n=1 Tax=Nematocida major TaxID=1912982 RepID=UPI002007D476|nr:uncharacterized protein NEMAJ01_0642 [Nematocida major]KAH9385746.1 hypothetical protein NEMAJ01_0642 [Nematocida major]